MFPQNSRHIVFGLTAWTFVQSIFVLSVRGDDPVKLQDTPTAAKSSDQKEFKYWIGLICHPVKAADKRKLGIGNGLVVEEVVANSPADEAGILVGDTLLKFDESELTKLEDLGNLVEEHKSPTVKITLIRNREELTVKVAITKRPQQYASGETPSTKKPNQDLIKEFPTPPATTNNTVKVEPTVNSVRSPKVDSKTAAELEAEQIRWLTEATKKAMNKLKAAKAKDEAQRKEESLGLEKNSSEELKKLKKRLDELDHKMDEILNLLKAENGSKAKTQN